MELLLLPKYDAGTIEMLRKTIQEHHEMYTTIFEIPLKPKHHFLTHYPNVIKHSGPPRYYACFRFESKHREIKAYTSSMNSRRNVVLSIGMKMLLRFSALAISGIKTNATTFEKHDKIESNYSDCLRHIFNENVSSYKSFKFKGRMFKKGHF